MYLGDHLILSAALAIVISPRLKLPFIPVLLMLIATNLIDLDHMFFFYLDDGTANSMLIHPLHLYSGCLIFTCAMLATFVEVRRFWYFILMIGFGWHLTLDAFAWSFHYRIPIMLGIALFTYPALYLLMRAKLVLPVSQINKIYALIVVNALASHGLAAWIVYGLKFRPAMGNMALFAQAVCILFCLLGLTRWFYEGKEEISVRL